jgi:hypothetical protein
LTGRRAMETIMASTGDRYVGTYEGYPIELIRNNWVKRLKLLIDGSQVDSASCMLLECITLTGTVEVHGVKHTVVAKSVPRCLLLTKYTIEVDGTSIPSTFN